jgi:hypothetical protein
MPREVGSRDRKEQAVQLYFFGEWKMTEVGNRDGTVQDVQLHFHWEMEVGRRRQAVQLHITVRKETRE